MRLLGAFGTVAMDVAPASFKMLAVRQGGRYLGDRGRIVCIYGIEKLDRVSWDGRLVHLLARQG